MSIPATERQPFCDCGHSYWSHHVGFYNAMGRVDITYGTLRHICERQGCRCMEYVSKSKVASK